MDEQRWYSCEHRVRSEDGIDLRVAVEPMKASDRMGNRATKSGNEKTAKLTLTFNEHWSGGLFGDNYVFEGVPISSLMDLHDTLMAFFSRPAVKDEVDRILLLRRIAPAHKGPDAVAEQNQ